MWRALFLILLILLRVDVEHRFVCDVPFSECQVDVAECRRALRLVQTAEDGGRYTPGPEAYYEYADRHGDGPSRPLRTVQDELDEEPAPPIQGRRREDPARTQAFQQHQPDCSRLSCDPAAAAEARQTRNQAAGIGKRVLVCATVSLKH